MKGKKIYKNPTENSSRSFVCQGSLKSKSTIWQISARLLIWSYQGNAFIGTSDKSEIDCLFLLSVGCEGHTHHFYNSLQSHLQILSLAHEYLLIECLKQTPNSMKNLESCFGTWHTMKSIPREFVHEHFSTPDISVDLLVYCGFRINSKIVQHRISKFSYRKSRYYNFLKDWDAVNFDFETLSALRMQSNTS